MEICMAESHLIPSPFAGSGSGRSDEDGDDDDEAREEPKKKSSKVTKAKKESAGTEITDKRLREAYRGEPWD